MASEGNKGGLPWGRGMAATALSATNLTVAGVAGVAAAAMHSVPVLALGGAAYAALMAWDLVTPAFWQKLIRAPARKLEPPPELPDPSTLKDPDAQRSAHLLLTAQKELKRVLAQSPESVQRYADVALVNVYQLEQAGARLLTRLDELATYLSTVDARGIEEEIRALDRQAKSTKDADAAAQFASAKEQREQQRKTLDELVAARDRVSANLSGIVATYESLPGRVIHMRALDAQAVDAFSGDVNQELDRMNHEIAAFEDTLKGLSTRVPA